jgi:acetoin utilization protein AcuB
MLTRELISNSIPYLHKQDTVFQALQLMNDYHVSHLPVVEDERYLGIISEEQLLHSDEEKALEQLPLENNNTKVQATDHFLKAIQVAVQSNLDGL